ncbi:inorganic phosphate transporter [Ruminococcaceae bacterium OttesenSCG-928-L11]|nr:inorganic phosphate transporter [Ruminococcaceae bacterium OttesenSCG-928-L11]
MTSVWGTVLTVLVLAVVFVNGWTDAPNAIASAVATKSISFRGAVRLAAVCNLLGLVIVSLISVSVADTITSMADFGGASLLESEIALCSAMAAIVLFAVAAWYFGIPTSESHALMAALAGASFALGRQGPGGAVWGKILLGLAMSLVMGFVLGYVATKMLGRLLLRARERTLDRLQIAAAGGMAFMHGAQDGQKFVAVLVAANMLAKGIRTTEPVNVFDNWVAFLVCGICMAVGTSIGGKRIIQSVGVKMVSIRKHQGVCSDLGSAVCLFVASLSGIPMSTTHTKTTAIMGAGMAGDRKSMDWSVIRKMLAAWAFTFPVCGAIGYLLTKLFLLVGQ